MRLQQSEIVRSIGDGGSLTDKIARATAQASALRDIPFHHDKLIASDGFIPFSDTIEEAARHRIRVVLEPEGALRSDDVETAAAAHGITLSEDALEFMRTKIRHLPIICAGELDDVARRPRRFGAPT